MRPHKTTESYSVCNLQCLQSVNVIIIRAVKLTFLINILFIVIIRTIRVMWFINLKVVNSCYATPYPKIKLIYIGIYIALHRKIHIGQC